MKAKRQNHHRGWKQALGVLLVFALAAGLVLGVPALSGVAYAAPVQYAPGDEGGAGQTPPDAAPLDGRVDLGTACSVTVEFSKTMAGVTEEDLKALQDKGAVSDLYLIAPAVRLSGYDVYNYCIDDTMPYYNLVKGYLEETSGWRTEALSKTAPDGYTGANAANEYLVFRYAPDDWMLADASEQEGLAELLAKICFAPELLPAAADGPALAALADSAAPASTKEIGQRHEALSAGLYLNVVHGSVETLKDWKNYIVLVESAGPGGSPEEKAGTIAYCDTKVYTFQPQLISLPGLAGFDANGAPQTDTTQNTAWAYDVRVTAKGEATGRFADLEITKNLTTYGDPVSFVFHVAAYRPDDLTSPVYEKVVPLTFTAAGTMTSAMITGKIPAGSTVVITEEYGGAGYRFGSVEASVSANEAYSGGRLPELVSSNGENSITITNIPAGRIYLTTPSAVPGGEENILWDGTAETVTFTNTHDDTNNGGGAVVNSFAQDENGGWTWTRRRFDPENHVWVDDEAAAVTQTRTGEG